MALDLARRFNAAVDLFNNEEYVVCSAEMDAMLMYSKLPNYWRIRCIIMLARTQDEWHDAEDQRVAAERAWATHRRNWPSGTDSLMDKTIDQLRVLLDELKAHHQEGQSSDYEEDPQHIQLL